MVLAAPIAFHFLPFFGFDAHGLHARIGVGLGRWNPLQQGIRVAFAHVPVVQFLHVGNAIQEARARLKQVGVFRQQPFRNDAAGMIFAFKVRVRKTEKEFFERPRAKVIGKKLLRVGAHDADIVVGSISILVVVVTVMIIIFAILVLLVVATAAARRHNAQTHVFGHLGTNFQTQNQRRGRQQFAQGHRQATKAATDIQDGGLKIVCISFIVVDFVSFVTLVGKTGIMIHGPIEPRGMNGIGEGIIVRQGIAMGPLTIKFLLGLFAFLKERLHRCSCVCC
mmetsp:Transcript_22722/g.63186  ORF Transcript_22722/g.63186 Transcript_22722/m.63186 type:complete len:280 (-) Transcript_22722:60-899(-)